MKNIQQTSYKIADELKDLIKKRELIYSNKRSNNDDFGEKAKYIVFSSNNINIAVMLKSVETLYNFEKINPLPIVPKYILGLFNHRGLVVPVIDLYYLIKGEHTNYSYILVFKGARDVVLSFAVTDLLELISVKPSEIRSIGVNVHDNIRRFVSGELADGTFILNTDLGGIL